MKILSAWMLAFALMGASGPKAASAADGITPAQEQRRAREELNRIRGLVGVAPVASSAGLNRAAAGHARYVVETGEYGHYESKKSSPYYIGYSPSDRARRYGYRNDGLSEDFYMGWLGGSGTPTYLQTDTAISWWMAAIYHRFPIVSPRSEDVGFGSFRKSSGNRSSSAQVLDFGTDYGKTGPPTRWPLPGQKGVGTELRGESPNPVVQFGGSFPTGYPVSMTWYRGSVKFTAITMKRSGDGKSVAGYKLSPQNDVYHKYSTSLSFIPKQPLDLGTAYSVSFAGKFNASGGDPDDGTAFRSAWSFTTMPGPGKLVTSSPASGDADVSRFPALKLSFNQPVRSYTLVRGPEQTLYGSGVGMSLVRESDGSEQEIAITAPRASTTKTVTLRPSAELAAGETYRLVFQLADAWGRPQRGSISFTTSG